MMTQSLNGWEVHYEANPLERGWNLPWESHRLDQGSWWTTVHSTAESQARLKWPSTGHTHTHHLELRVNPGFPESQAVWREVLLGVREVGMKCWKVHLDYQLQSVHYPETFCVQSISIISRICFHSPSTKRLLIKY